MESCASAVHLSLSRALHCALHVSWPWPQRPLITPASPLTAPFWVQGAPKRPQLQQRRGGGPLPPQTPPLGGLSPAQQHQQQLMQGYGQLMGWPPHGMYGSGPPGGGYPGGGGGAYGPPPGMPGMFGSPQRPVQRVPTGKSPYSDNGNLCTPLSQLCSDTLQSWLRRCIYSHAAAVAACLWA